MKLTVLQEDLEKSLNFVAGFVSTRAQLPILANILFSAQKGQLRLAATNLEMGISAALGAKVDKTGQTTIPARVIVELINSAPPGKITIEEKGDKITLTSNFLKATVNGISAKEFPQVPKDISSPAFTFPTESLQTINKKVSFSAAMDEGRPVLTGVFLSFEEKKLKAVATDGFRLSYKEIETKNEKEQRKEELIIPVKALNEIVKMQDQDKEGAVNAVVEKKEGQILFSTDSIVLTSKLIEGEFPDYKKIIPKEEVYKAYLGKEDLVMAVRSTAVFARDAANVVKLAIGKDSILVFAESSQTGSNKVEISAKTEGGEVEVAFNYKYLLDFLGSVDGEQIYFSTQGATFPGVFKDPKEESYFHLIMPVRIQT